MLQRKVDEWERRVLGLIEREWKWFVLVIWLALCAWFIF